MDFSRPSRLVRIREILEAEAISAQDDLVQRLKDEGFAVTQSAISRDLRELGVAKVQGFYRPAALEVAAAEASRGSEWLQGFAAAGPNLLVLSTAVGAASRVALALDQRAWPEIVGTIAGDDTVFVAIRSADSQASLTKKLHAWTEEFPDV